MIAPWPDSGTTDLSGYTRLAEYNKCHNPPGSSAGGEFCSDPGDVLPPGAGGGGPKTGLTDAQQKGLVKLLAAEAAGWPKRNKFGSVQTGVNTTVLHALRAEGYFSSKHIFLRGGVSPDIKVLKRSEDAPPGGGGERPETLGGMIDRLKAYPEVARNYPRDSGTEMGSIESHTKDVGHEWATQLSQTELAGISGRFGSDVSALMNTAIALHDIGKPDALAAGDKHRQHEYTVPILHDILTREGFSRKDVALAIELLNHDLIGPLFRGRGTDTEVAAALKAKAKKVGIGVRDFVTLQLAFYQADAAAYPYLHRYMQRSGKRWTFAGAKPLAAIEALTR